MTDFRSRLGRELLIFDGAYGTMLQSKGLPAKVRPEIWNITNQDAIVDLHRAYISAGADIIKTNTFGANLIHFPDGAEHSLEKVVASAINAAHVAADSFSKQTYIALDIGPLGKMIGRTRDLDFEEAVSVFARTVRAGRDGCDLVLLETFGDLAEVRAALLAVKENCDLPVVVTNVYSGDGRTFSGTDAEIMARILSGMGADAIGMNCSMGPFQMESIVPVIAHATSLPVVVNPNAGLPVINDLGIAQYDITPDAFVESMLRIIKSGASVVGGCCGTTPEYISKLKAATKGLSVPQRKYSPKRVICSATRTAVIGEKRLTVIGERINPTGKSKLKEALRAGDIDYLLGEAHKQAACGADILDVNTGLPEIDEKTVLALTVESIQSVCDLPLQIDTADPVAMEYALRRYNGRALINSVNGTKASMDAILPLAAKYGGMIVALTLDEGGIPDTPEGRYEIAEKILSEAEKYGLTSNDILVDPLTLTLGADPEAANKTLKAVKLITEKLGLSTSLGVSNISFGLPDREKINRDFLLAAISEGIAAAIMNPCSAAMMNAARIDTCGDADYATLISAHLNASDNVNSSANDLAGCIRGGLTSKAARLAEEYSAERTPTDIIDRDVIPALEEVGALYEKGKMFLPGLLSSAEAAISALDVLLGVIEKRGGEEVKRGAVVLATVEGDIHDIGKNIVGVLLKSYGFKVIDLGRDVSPSTVLASVKEHGVRLVGLSALMTTTLPAMKRTVELLARECPDVKVVVGGAVLSEEYAKSMKAHKYAPTALDTVKFASEVYS